MSTLFNGERKPRAVTPPRRTGRPLLSGENWAVTPPAADGGSLLRSGNRGRGITPPRRKLGGHSSAAETGRSLLRGGPGKGGSLLRGGNWAVTPHGVPVVMGRDAARGKMAPSRGDGLPAQPSLSFGGLTTRASARSRQRLPLPVYHFLNGPRRLCRGRRPLVEERIALVLIIKGRGGSGWAPLFRGRFYLVHAAMNESDVSFIVLLFQWLRIKNGQMDRDCGKKTDCGSSKSQLSLLLGFRLFFYQHASKNDISFRKSHILELLSFGKLGMEAIRVEVQL